MKRFYSLQAAVLLSFFIITSGFAQSADPTPKAYAYLLAEYGLDARAVGNLKIKDRYTSDHNGVEHVHFTQVHEGLEIFGTHFNLAVLQDGSVSASGHQLMMLHPLPEITTSPKIKAEEAIGIISAKLNINTRSVPVKTGIVKNNAVLYSKSDISLQDIPVEMGLIRTSDGKLTLVWKAVIESTRDGILYQSFINAVDGNVVAIDKMTLQCMFEHGYLHTEDHCTNLEPTPVIKKSLAPPSAVAFGSYRVLPLSVESPNHGSFELVTGMEDINASPFGWHDTDGAIGNEFTITRGNNVHAFLDRNWDYLPDGDLDGGVNLLFDFPYNPDTEPSANQEIALTNLFFWNNVMHDFAYSYGFTEVAGNFQETNYSGMGGNEDYVNAHAQFGDTNPIQCGDDVNGGSDCLNNADFSTPVDGFNGRMRMFTWDNDNSGKLLDVLEPLEFAGKITTGTAAFGADITSEPVTGFVIIADDGTTSPTHGCGSLAEQPDVEGKIVLIDRGLCDFSEKVYNAQEAGAIGAIICNFDESVIQMGAGINAEFVTIPSVFISKGDCDRIRDAAGNGLRVSLVAPEDEGGPVRRDGSLDNSVIAHEFGHGISTRLTGGPSNSSCLSPGATTGDAEEAWGMGEGWSDFFALVTTVRSGDTGNKKRGIGTFANKESTDGRGIRTYPYSTDMSINPHTYDDILFESVPHGVGSVWTAMLWDLYWAFTEAYGWDPDLYHGTGGNNIAIQLVMDGLKLQPCNPGFIDARNAILQADQINNNGINECLIWQVFARRGLGWDADGGDKNSRSDGVQGFQPLPTCVKELKLTKTMTPEIIAGDQIEVTLHAVNHTDGTLTNVALEDLIPEGTTYIPGSANIEPVSGNSLVWTLDELLPGEEVNISYTLQSAADKHSVRILYDDIEGFALDRWDVTFDPDKESSNIWTQQDALAHSGSSSWYVQDIELESEHYLENFETYPVDGNYPVYRFFHYYDTEPGADGGFLEISTNNGNSWIPLGDKVFRNGYPRKLQYTTFAIPNLYAFSGLSSPSLEWTPVYIDLREYAGEDIKIRYRFGTDENTPKDGWYVDDVEIMDAVLYNSFACITSDQTDLVCAEAPERGTIVDSQVTIGTDDGTRSSGMTIMPNPASDYLNVHFTKDHNEEVTLSVFDLTGRIIYQTNWSATEGSNQLVINTQQFTPGLYVLQVTSETAMLSEKFIRE